MGFVDQLFTNVTQYSKLLTCYRLKILSTNILNPKQYQMIKYRNSKHTGRVGLEYQSI